MMTLLLLLPAIFEARAPKAAATPETAPRGPDGGATPKTSDDVPVEEAPRVEPQPPFWLVHHPNKWTVVDGKVVPGLNKLLLAPGLNGCEVKRDGTLNVKNARQNLAESGKTEIPWDIDGPGTSYLKNPLPNVWTTKWERFYGGSVDVTGDTAAYAAWCRELIGKEYKGKVLVKPPTVPVLERLAAPLEKELGDLAMRPLGQEVRIAQLQRMLEAVRAELAVRIGEEQTAAANATTTPSGLSEVD